MYHMSYQPESLEYLFVEEKVVDVLILEERYQLYHKNIHRNQNIYIPRTNYNDDAANDNTLFIFIAVFCRHGNASIKRPLE